MKPLFQKRVGIGVKASGLIFACVILVSVDASTLWLKSFKTLAGTALEPVLMISQWPNQAADSFSVFFTTRKTFRDEIERLNLQILTMRTSTQKMAALLQENNRLRQLLGSSERIQEAVLITEVIGVDPNPNHARITVDKGTSDNVAIGQAVIDDRGLVGKVVASTLGTSTILLITDQTQAVPVRSLRSGLQLIVEGGGGFADLVGRHVPGTADLRVGDTLVTSGLGQVFPNGYPVAVVSQFEQSQGNPFAIIQAKPLAHLSARSHVLILFSTAVMPENYSNGAAINGQ